MVIETKYELSQEVWLMNNNKPEIKIITKIIVIYEGAATNISYGMTVSSCATTVPENQLFPTKEELLKSL